MRKLLIVISALLAISTSAMGEVKVDSASLKTSPAAKELDIEVVSPWRRMPNGPNTAIYFTVNNKGKADASLINVTSDDANKVEIHQSMTDEKGVTKMVHIDKLLIPAGTSVELKPGGLHIMLLGLRNSENSKEPISLNLYFDDGTQLSVVAPVK